MRGDIFGLGKTGLFDPDLGVVRWAARVEKGGGEGGGQIGGGEGPIRRGFGPFWASGTF